MNVLAFIVAVPSVGMLLSALRNRFAAQATLLGSAAAMVAFFAWQLPSAGWALHWLAGFPLELGLPPGAVAGQLVPMVLVVSLLVQVYCWAYFADKAKLRRFVPVVGLFTSAMLLLLFSQDLLSLFLGWEVMGACSFLLISFDRTKEGAGRAGLFAFVLNRVGDVALLLGMGVYYAHLGTLSVGAVAQVGDVPAAALWLFLGGAFVKSAQAPFAAWLAEAMAGPAPASALIHAATMVVAGVVLIAKLGVALTPTMLQVVLVVGLTTCLLGGLVAAAQTDAKKLLAWSTVSQLGLMMVGLAVFPWHGESQGYALGHVLTHGFFKAGLFLALGAVVAQRATYGLSQAEAQDLTRQHAAERGPYKWLMVVMGLSLVGMPFTSGFWSKEEIFNHLAGHYGATSTTVLVVVISAVSALYVGRLLSGLFHWRRGAEKRPWQRRLAFLVPVGLMAVASLGFTTEIHWSLAVPSVLAGGAGLLLGWKGWLALHRVQPLTRAVYFRELFSGVLAPAGFRLARGADRFDVGLQVLVRRLAQVQLVGAHFLKFLDHRLIDGTVRAVGWTALWVGAGVRSVLMSGRVQTYVAWLLLIVGLGVVLRLIF